MKKFMAAIAAITVFGLVSTSLQAAQVRNSINGATGVAENACVLPIAVFVGLNCEFSGGATHGSELGLYPADNIGPLNSGGFYASAGLAPGFILSTLTGNEFDWLDRPLTSFLVGVPTAPADGKLGAPITGVVTIDDGGDGFGDTTDTIAGTIILGPGARVVSSGGNLAGDKTIQESWTSVTHTLLPTVVSSATANAGGGFDYVIGSRGFPTNITTATPESFAAELAADSGDADRGIPPFAPWIDVNGGSISTTIAGTLDIVSFGTKAGVVANVGGETTAVIAGLNCSDVGTDPTEADTMGNAVIDTVTDCQDSSVAWGVTDPVGTDIGKLNAGFDNLVLKLSTDDTGAITAADAYYTMEYPIIQLADTSWVGGTLDFTGMVITSCVAGPDTFEVIDDITLQTLAGVLDNDSCAVEPFTVFNDTAAGDFMPDKGGTATTDGTLVTYTPAGGGAADNPEMFTYTVQDGVADPLTQAQGTVTITLFDDVIPVANNIATTTELDKPVEIDVSSAGDDPNNNLGNTETAVTNSPGTGSIVTETAPVPTLGTVNIIAEKVVYTPDEGERGDDTFGYTITDSNNDTASAEISVSINAMPVANDFTVAAPVAIGGSADIDVATIPLNDLGNPVATVTIELPGPDNGTTSVAGSVITYTNSSLICGDDGFDYTITDDDAESATGAISLTVNCVPIANDANAPDINTVGVAPETQSSAVDVAGIAGNDLGNAPTDLTVADGATGTTAVNGTIVTYTPDVDFFAGSDTFDYTLTDADSDTDTGTVTVTLPDAAPVVGDLSVQTGFDEAVVINLASIITSLGNGSIGDHGFDGTEPSKGTVSLAGNQLTYRPDSGTSGTDSFTITLTDGDGDSDTGTITVTVGQKIQDELPGGSNAVGSELALLLILLPWLRRRRIG